MRSLFDLRNIAEVRRNASRILDKLESGSMPCDVMWPEADVEVFRSWVTNGMAD